MYVARPAVAYRHIQIPITLLIEYAAGPGMIINDGSCKLYVDHTRMYTHVIDVLKYAYTVNSKLLVVVVACRTFGSCAMQCSV